VLTARPAHRRHPPPTRTSPTNRPRSAPTATRSTPGFGPRPLLAALYRTRAADERRLYHRLHQEVDTPLERVRAAVVAGSDEAVLVRTADHGELLGAHGGLQQKWFTLYDEATRVPFAIARTGRLTTEARSVTAPTSHVDLLPTLLAAAGIDPSATADRLAERFTELHPLPGRDLLPVVHGAEADEHRVVYLQTRDNIFEGDVLATAAASKLGVEHDPPPVLRAAVPTGVGTSVEGVVARVPDSVADGGRGHLWKLVRTFDDPATWTEPHSRQLDSSGFLGETYRTLPLEDQWELYDLDDDPTEACNRWSEPVPAELREHLLVELDQQRTRCVPARTSTVALRRAGAASRRDPLARRRARSAARPVARSRSAV
jgi:arylsulfatase A-like enzyme